MQRLSRLIMATGSNCPVLKPTPSSIPALGQVDAIQLDEKLFADGGFSLDQLMELAGLAAAQSLQKEYSTETHPRVLIACGPGNNGGDGLVMARHLSHFGYKPTVVYPKEPKQDLYKGLLKQLQHLNVPILKEWAIRDTDIVVDAVFGFSFKGWRGEGKDVPFDTIVGDFENIKEIAPKVPLVSIDIPSGWHVEKGPEGSKVHPDMLISLTAPKIGVMSSSFVHHYLGGRFVPPPVAEEYKLQGLPQYPNADQCVRLN